MKGWVLGPGVNTHVLSYCMRRGTVEKLTTQTHGPCPFIGKGIGSFSTTNKCWYAPFPEGARKAAPAWHVQVPLTVLTLCLATRPR